MNIITATKKIINPLFKWLHIITDPLTKEAIDKNNQEDWKDICNGHYKFCVSCDSFNPLSCHVCTKFYETINKVAPDGKSALTYIKGLYLFHKTRMKSVIDDLKAMDELVNGKNDGCYSLEDYDKV